MQAFAKETEDKLSEINKDESTSLFVGNEIIFPDENIERTYTRYGYKISNLQFLVPEKVVSEVIQSPNIYSLPNSPIWIEGMLNIRGNIVPVMNVGKLLKENNPERLTNVLVLNSSNNAPSIALMISGLPISLEVNNSKQSASKNIPDLLQEFVTEGFNQNDLDWFEFEPKKLFRNLANK